MASMLSAYARGSLLFKQGSGSDNNGKRTPISNNRSTGAASSRDRATRPVNQDIQSVHSQDMRDLLYGSGEAPSFKNIERNAKGEGATRLSARLPFGRTHEDRGRLGRNDSTSTDIGSNSTRSTNLDNLSLSQLTMSQMSQNSNSLRETSSVSSYSKQRATNRNTLYDRPKYSGNFGRRDASRSDASCSTASSVPTTTIYSTPLRDHTRSSHNANRELQGAQQRQHKPRTVTFQTPQPSWKSKAIGMGAKAMGAISTSLAIKTPLRFRRPAPLNGGHRHSAGSHDHKKEYVPNPPARGSREIQQGVLNRMESSSANREHLKRRLDLKSGDLAMDAGSVSSGGMHSHSGFEALQLDEVRASIGELKEAEWRAAREKAELKNLLQKIAWDRRALEDLSDSLLERKGALEATALAVSKRLEEQEASEKQHLLALDRKIDEGVARISAACDKQQEEIMKVVSEALDKSIRELNSKGGNTVQTALRSVKESAAKVVNELVQQAQKKLRDETHRCAKDLNQHVTSTGAQTNGEAIRRSNAAKETDDDQDIPEASSSRGANRSNSKKRAARDPSTGEQTDGDAVRCPDVQEADDDQDILEVSSPNEANRSNSQKSQTQDERSIVYDLRTSKGTQSRNESSPSIDGGRKCSKRSIIPDLVESTCSIIPDFVGSTYRKAKALVVKPTERKEPKTKRKRSVPQKSVRRSKRQKLASNRRKDMETCASPKTVPVEIIDVRASQTQFISQLSLGSHEVPESYDKAGSPILLPTRPVEKESGTQKKRASLRSKFLASDNPVSGTRPVSSYSLADADEKAAGGRILRNRGTISLPRSGDNDKLITPASLTADIVSPDLSGGRSTSKPGRTYSRKRRYMPEMYDDPYAFL